MIENKKKKFGWDNWVNELNEQKKQNIPYDLDEIAKQLEKDDYSSLDPEIRKEIEEREKKKKVAKSGRKQRPEKTI